MNKIVTLCICVIITILMFVGTVSAAEKVFFYYTDPAGTPLAMTDTSGNVVWKADYKPFGEEQSITGTIENNEKFVGKEKDKETGLYYFGARYMNDKIGRFVTVDPVWIKEKDLMNPQRLNRYAYSLNNPYRYIDPDGKFAQEVHRRMTMQILTRGGVSVRAVGKIAEGNVYVDRPLNQGNNYQHAMRDVGQNREEAIRMSSQFSRERLLDAGRLIASGDYEKGLFELGRGLHTIQDKKHGWITLPEHLSPRENWTDFNPTPQQEERAQADTEQYMKDFWSTLKHDLKLSDRQVDKIKKDLEKY